MRVNVIIVTGIVKVSTNAEKNAKLSLHFSNALYSAYNRKRVAYIESKKLVTKCR